MRNQNGVNGYTQDCVHDVPVWVIRRIIQISSWPTEIIIEATSIIISVGQLLICIILRITKTGTSCSTILCITI